MTGAGGPFAELRPLDGESGNRTREPGVDPGCLGVSVQRITALPPLPVSYHTLKR